MLDASPTDTTTSETTETTTEAPADAAPAEVAASPAEGSILGGDAPAKEGEPPAVDPAPVVPEKYELSAPEGMTFDDDALAVADPVFRELGLTNDAAQKLMPVAGDFAQRVASAALERAQVDAETQFAAQKATWADEAKKDAEIGGAKWDETVTLSARALDMLGYPAGSPFRQFLTETGLGNHPEMIRAMRRIGERVSDDSFERGNGASNTPPKSVADRWYPKKEGTN
jgi:hypothetical protein